MDLKQGLTESERHMKLKSPVAVVHRISKAWCVDDGECELNAPLLYQHFGLFHLKGGSELLQQDI